jgi:calcium/calmodulin-dependent protein kinase I
VVDKSRYASGDNSLEREIQVLCKVRQTVAGRAVSWQLGRRTSAEGGPPLQVDHPNCIKLNAVYITPRKVYIVTELVSGGELLDRWGQACFCWPLVPPTPPLPAAPARPCIQLVPK